jgi:hypothetical protein
MNKPFELPRSLSGRRAASRTSARALGWFSIGLGVAQLLMPRTMSRVVGVEGREGMMRACGLREIVTGIGILSSSNPAPWVWARVAGDALDLAALGKGFVGSDRKGSLALAAGAAAGVTFADYATAQILSEIELKDRTYFRDYSTRSGFSRPAAALRGTVREVRGSREEPSRPGPRPATPLQAS